MALATDIERPLARGHTGDRVDRDPPARLVLDPLGVSIAFHSCVAAAHGFHSILRGWGDRPTADVRLPPADVRIVRSGGVHRWQSAALAKPFMWSERAPSTTMDVICDLHDVLFDWFLDRHRDYLCLHAASIEVGNGLVMIPSVGKAGKSTLSVGMAMLGHRVFGDDVLALEPGSDDGLAFGVLPRLRLPLPDRIGQRFRRFLSQRSGPSNADWVYADLREGKIAHFGATAPVKAIVFLDRRPSGRARLAPVDNAHVLGELVRQNFAEGVAPTAAFTRLLGLASRAQCRRLVYSDTIEAARLLSAELSDDPAAQPAPKTGQLIERGVERHFGDALFLVSQTEDAVLSLGPAAAALWRQLTLGRSRKVVTALFQSAFPEVDRATIGADIAQAFATLAAHGLVRHGRAISRVCPG